MVLAIILFIVVVVWLFVTYQSRKRMKFCRWRENRGKDGPQGHYYVCMNCGAETFQTGEKPPSICLRPEEPGAA
ncbi:MAG: hypothetical protein KDA73_08000 [Rhodobacteraceae bacterium]|nr:hypothetical protein [Paracoccaceae bacterium]